MDKNKQALLAKTLNDINKRFGTNSVMMMDQKEIPKLDVIKTGSYLLNECLGVGGYPKGRIIEIYGPESAGKTTLALHALAECQKNGGVGAIIDVEHALDPTYAAALGVSVSDLIISQPDCGEDALEIAESLVRSGVVDLIVIDSVAALTPKAEIEGEMGDASMGLQARLMSKACRKLVACINQTGSTVIFINQIREKIGVMYGNPETTTGGRALKFFSSVRLEIRKGDVIKDGSTSLGHKLKIKVVKNKVAPPFKNCEINVIWGKGIDASAEVLDIAISKDIIQKSGAWFEYDGQRFQGRHRVEAYFAENPAEFEKLANTIFTDVELPEDIGAMAELDND